MGPCDHLSEILNKRKKKITDERKKRKRKRRRCEERESVLSWSSRVKITTQWEIFSSKRKATKLGWTCICLIIKRET